MKKAIKRLLLAVTILLALFGAATGIAFASGYITWGGSNDYFQLIENLNLISERGQGLKTDKESVERELEQMNNKLLDKDNEINALEQEITALEQRLEGNKTTQDQLRQAEIDMKDAKNKSEQVLSEFR